MKDYYALTTTNVKDNKDPRNFEEAISSSESIHWKNAMDDELDSIKKNKVWELVELPKGRKPIGCKWIFKKKFKSDGTLDKYKARLVAKGYTQKPGVDYEETYSPVAKFVSIRIIMALVAKLDLELFQFDVKAAFLNGELKEDIYMEQPKGFEKKDLEDKDYKLNKSLYGLNNPLDNGI